MPSGYWIPLEEKLFDNKGEARTCFCRGVSSANRSNRPEWSERRTIYKLLIFVRKVMAVAYDEVRQQWRCALALKFQ